MKKVALVPVYNEEATLRGVLEKLCPEVDLVVLVDDGSRDGSLALAREFAWDRHGIEILSLPANLGMSAALREGFLYVAREMQADRLGPDDVLLTLDADGQHDPRAIDGICRYLQSRALDVVLARRDFSLYPWHKRAGNTLLTVWGSVWSGMRYRDVESGFRAMRLAVIPSLLSFYTGFRYSCAQEIAVITARTGFRVDNSYATSIQLYRSQTRLRDVFINAGLGLWAFARCTLGLQGRGRPGLARMVSGPGPERTKDGAGLPWGPAGCADEEKPV